MMHGNTKIKITDVFLYLCSISGGELFERVVADDFTLTERDCILFTRQICEGVDYMHQSYVVHLDLKVTQYQCSCMMVQLYSSIFKSL